MGLAADLGIGPGPRPRPPVARLLLRLAGTRTGARLYSLVLHHLDRAVFALSGDRLSFTEPASRLPTVMLTTIGARSRRLRRVPLVAFPVDGHVAVPGTTCTPN
ncbi:MAG TPA: hypothetical protein VFP72_15560 [Kineosporiaceae bacterium]|nr:hypothetical protein [Kineosporiaceae bacterium]